MKMVESINHLNLYLNIIKIFFLMSEEVWRYGLLDDLFLLSLVFLLISYLMILMTF